MEDHETGVAVPNGYREMPLVAKRPHQQDVDDNDRRHDAPESKQELAVGCDNGGDSEAGVSEERQGKRESLDHVIGF